MEAICMYGFQIEIVETTGGIVDPISNIGTTTNQVS